MARKKAKFGRPVRSTEDLPDYLKDFENLDNVPCFVHRTIEDCVWLGDDGNLDPQPIVDEITAPTALLRLIVRAIIGGNPSSGMSSEDRVEQAMRALLGTRGQKGRRPLSSDEGILRRMAVEFLEGFHDLKVPRQSLNALADWALQAEPGFAEKGYEWKENRRRTIARKFENGRDRLLIELVSTYDWEVQRNLAIVKNGHGDTA